MSGGWQKNTGKYGDTLCENSKVAALRFLRMPPIEVFVFVCEQSRSFTFSTQSGTGVSALRCGCRGKECARKHGRWAGGHQKIWKVGRRAPKNMKTHFMKRLKSTLRKHENNSATFPGHSLCPPIGVLGYVCIREHVDVFIRSKQTAAGRELGETTNPAYNILETQSLG